ncbi:hypothetical protein MRX96_032366 [Rhipicephalus microplus]
MPVLPELFQLQALLHQAHHGTARARGILRICTSSQTHGSLQRITPVRPVQRTLHLPFQLLRVQLAEIHLYLRPEPPFPALKDVVEARLPHRRHPRVPNGLKHFGDRFFVDITLRASTMPGHSSATFGTGCSTPRQSRSVPGTPPSVPQDSGPSSTTGEVLSAPGSSFCRHTGPGSASSASRASSWMSTELADLPGTEDSDDISPNELVHQQSVLAAGPVVDHRPLLTTSRSPLIPFPFQAVGRDWRR